MPRKSSSSKSSPQWIVGIHAVAASVTHDPEHVRELLIQADSTNRRLTEIADTARQHGITVRVVAAQALDGVAGKLRHQGIAARYEAATLLGMEALEALITAAAGKALVLVLDGVQDPHNLGACLRSAAAAGVTAVIIPTDRSAPVNATVRKTSAGAADQLAIVAVPNVVRALKQLQKWGVWIYGLSAAAPHPLYQWDLQGNIALVMGGESQGLRHLTAQTCDDLGNIPMPGAMESLNVSVATGIALFEVVRQRGYV